MDRFFCLLLAILLILHTNCQQNDTNGQRNFDIEQLKSTRALLKKAMLAGNVGIIDQIYSENYKIVTRKGAIRSRSDRIDMLQSGKLEYFTLGNETEVTFEIYDKVVVVRGIVSSAETEFEGEKRRSGPRRFTEIWINKNGNWLQVGRHSTSIATSAP